MTEKVEKDATLFGIGLKWASEFGNERMVKVLRKFLTDQIDALGEENVFVMAWSLIQNLPEVLHNAILTDKVNICEEIKQICLFLKYNFTGSDLAIANKILAFQYETK